ncbi:MAG: lipoprotein-releasing system transmembrane subunit LolC, partial [Succinivibrionaceae bacterium]|nr:lipoprotein-releasing system transmembrane subunit LolC [Succinivibrionaceae bacterium]
MRITHPLPLAIALRYGSASRRAQGFAALVGLISTVGIAIGVAALIVVSSVMDGLEGRLRGAILSDVPHLIAAIPVERAAEAVLIPGVLAACP